MRIGHVNINRLCTHFSELEAHYDANRYDLLAITETFLDQSCSSELLRLPAMDLYRHDRVGKIGGGICLYARSDFTVTELSRSNPADHDNPEYIILRINSSKFSILFAIVYRPPETHLPLNFLDDIAKFIPLFSHVIITGDFNINMLKITDNSTYFRRHFSSRSLHLVDSPPTHHTLWQDGSAHHTWLDLFLLKDPDRLVEYRKSADPFTVGHDFIEIDYSLRTPPPSPLRISSRNLNHLNSTTVSPHLTANLTALLSSTFPMADARSVQNNLRPGFPALQTDFFATAISNAIKNTFDKLAPMTTFTTSPRKKPWVTADIRRLISERRRLYRTACRSQTEHSVRNYRRVRNEVCSRLSTAKNNFIAHRISKVTSVTDKWRELRKLGFGSHNSNTPFKYFTPDTLNSHFASEYGASPPLTHADVTLAYETPITDGLATFDFTQVTEEDVRLALTACNSSSVGADGLSADMMKLSLPTILPHLTSLINSSLESGTFPADWKKALIVPLLKIPSPKSPSDTRPIALLSTLSKIIERIVHRQLTAHLTAHDLFDPRQSGFRPLHSTQTALLGILEDVRLGIEKKKLTGLLAFDFSKAFDTLPHSRILLKLRKIGCSDGVIRWFSSYLSDRTQAV